MGGMPRFTLKDLLIATALISARLSTLYCIFALDWESPQLRHSPPKVPWLLGGAMIGAGALTPFRRPGLGVILVFAVQGVILLIVRR
jgi:hypothetical protein